MKFLDREFGNKVQDKIKTKFADIGFTSDGNGNSMFGTFWTQSTSAISGITESVLTPGFRFIKFVAGVMQVFKKLTYNLNVIKDRITRISNIMEAFGNGKHNHIRKSVIKYKVNVK